MDNDIYRFGSANRTSAESDLPEYRPTIDTHDVFRELIASEIRDGRLSASRRRRIIRYAAHLGLSAVETGQLIAHCREQAVPCDNPDERAYALRLAPAEPARIPKPILIALAVIVFAALNALALNWWGG